jgi:hypothetical protein
MSSHPSTSRRWHGTGLLCLCDPQDEAEAGAQSRFSRGRPPVHPIAILGIFFFALESLYRFDEPTSLESR